MFKEIYLFLNKYSCSKKVTVYNACFQNEAPEPEPHCALASVEKAKLLWRPESIKSEPYIFTIEMHNIVPFGELIAVHHLYFICVLYVKIPE